MTSCCCRSASGSRRPATRFLCDPCSATSGCPLTDRATQDPQRVRAWWSTAPYNIGVATGSGLVVIDLDTPKRSGQPSGWQALVRLAREHGQQVPRRTRVVATAGGGWHLYFSTPTDATLRNTAGTLADCIDTRATGGYVVGPGSMVSGRRYRIANAAALAPLPDWITENVAAAASADLPDAG